MHLNCEQEQYFSCVYTSVVISCDVLDMMRPQLWSFSSLISLVLTIFFSLQSTVLPTDLWTGLMLAAVSSILIQIIHSFIPVWLLCARCGADIHYSFSLEKISNKEIRSQTGLNEKKNIYIYLPSSPGQTWKNKIKLKLTFINLY